jgi:hypothetical protein
VGCGTGLVSQHLAPVTKFVYGADVSAGMAAAFDAKAQAADQLRERMAAACVSLSDPAAVAAEQAAGRLPAAGTVEVRGQLGRWRRRHPAAPALIGGCWCTPECQVVDLLRRLPPHFSLKSREPPQAL